MRKKAFMSLKFHDASDGLDKVEADKKKVDGLTNALLAADIENVVMVRDVEKYGEVTLPKGSKLMPDYAFPAMDKCDMLICEFSEKGVGLGVGAGYAYAKGIPVYIIAKTGSDISSTMRDLAEEVIFYDDYDEITDAFKKIMEREKFKIILASKSKIRRQMMDEAGYDYSVVVSDADETPNEDYCIMEQIVDIASRKAKAVFNATKDQGKRIIVAADQNIYFGNTLYGKPKSIEEARVLIQSMRGSNEIYAYTGNFIIVADGEKYMFDEKSFFSAQMRMDNISDDELEEYLQNGNPLSKCGGISIYDTPFLHMVSGDLSSAQGMTISTLERTIERCNQIPKIFL